MLNRFEKWILRKILKKIVRDEELIMLFRQIWDYQRIIFFEDNYFTCKAHIQEDLDFVFNEASKKL